ncbi:hypothetical protein NL676_006488 [Syzygium grande]|nr:hypothetical protein NL676_006488 [Syzygium grande]
MFDDLTANPIQRTDSFESDTKAKKHMGGDWFRDSDPLRTSHAATRGMHWASAWVPRPSELLMVIVIPILSLLHMSWWKSKQRNEPPSIIAPISCFFVRTRWGSPEPSTAPLSPVTLIHLQAATAAFTNMALVHAAVPPRGAFRALSHGEKARLAVSLWQYL